MTRRRIWIISSLLIAGTLAWALVAGTGTPNTSYRFVAVTEGTIESTVSATGTLQATETVEVGTQVSGQIAEIYVDFNEGVEAGQLLATIDPILLEQAVRSAEVGLARRKAELDQTTRETDRTRQLHDLQVVSEQELEVQLYQLALAEANYLEAEIGLNRAERNLEYSKIRAPIGGVVIARSVDVGQTVAASLQAPVLFVLAKDLSQMEILAAVDESDIGLIAEGQEVHFSVQAYADRNFEGRVQQVRLQASTQDNVVTYGVVVSVDNADGALLPGMTATIDVVIEKAENALSVSNTALRFRPTDDMIQALAERAEPADGPAAEGARAGTAQSGARPNAAARSGSDSGAMASLWYLGEDGALRTARVRTGLTDGVSTVIASQSEDIQAGLSVIAAIATASTASTENPFQAQSQQAGPGGGRGGVR